MIFVTVLVLTFSPLGTKIIQNTWWNSGRKQFCRISTGFEKFSFKINISDGDIDALFVLNKINQRLNLEPFGNFNSKHFNGFDFNNWLKIRYQIPYCSFQIFFLKTIFFLVAFEKMFEYCFERSILAINVYSQILKTMKHLHKVLVRLI